MKRSRSRNRWWWRGDTEACTDRQADRETALSSLSRMRDWTFTFSLLVDDVAQFFKHYSERTLCPISSVVLTSSDGGERSNFNILIDIYFLPFYFFFSHFYAALDFCYKTPVGSIAWTVTSARHNSISTAVTLSQSLSSGLVYQQRLYPMGCVNKDWQGTQQTTSCKYPRHTNERARAFKTAKPIS